MVELGKWLGEITPGGVGIWTVVGLVVVALIRQRPITQKLTNEREGNLLRERTRDMRGMRRRISELEAEQRVDRHSIANLEQILETFLEFVEAYPERAQEWAIKARQKIEQQKLERATEKAGIFAGKTAPEPIEGDDPILI